MKPETQRIAIAEACGWTEIRYVGEEFGLEGTSPDGVDMTALPNYTGNLNAMHDAWHTLGSKQKRFAFHEQLRRAVIQAGGHASSTSGDIDCCCENATAAQRAEAFLRSLGLWKEGK